MKAIIIDDEQQGINALSSLLEIYCPEVNILASATSAEEGLKIIRSLDFELLFLDVEMPLQSGFDLLNEVEDIRFEVIFTTAYDQYAIKAFRFSALDYLLKPINETELTEAVRKAGSKKEKSRGRLRFNELNGNIRAAEYGMKRLAVSTTDSVIFLPTEDIVCIKAEGNYSWIISLNKERSLASKPLRDFEEVLDPQLFFRVHKSWLINLKHVKKFIKADGGYLTMTDGSNVEVAQRRRIELMQVLGL